MNENIFCGCEWKLFVVALNYGVFRHKVFNSTALNYMFFDIGATGTTATIVGELLMIVQL